MLACRVGSPAGAQLLKGNREVVEYLLVPLVEHAPLNLEVYLGAISTAPAK